MDRDRVSARQLITLTFAALLSPAIRVLPGRTAQLAGDALGFSSRRICSAPAGTLARVSPFTGSMTMTCLPCFLMTS